MNISEILTGIKNWAVGKLNLKQDSLVSGTNIKTINNASLLGSGNISTGTVTSVGAGTGLSISGDADENPTVNIASGYKLPTTTEWNAKAPLASPALTGTPTAPTASAGTNTTQIATTAFVKTAIDALPEPMLFKGSLGEGGTISELPAASASNEGYTYKVITAGTYAGQSAKIGDTFISTGSEWVLIPSGDEPSGTVISVGAGTGLSISGNQSINPTVNVATGYKLPTTTEWNGKQDAIADLEEIRSNAEHGAAADVKITAAQTKIAWVDEFEWTDEQVWPKKSGGGGGGDAKALRTMPTFSKRGRPKFDNCVFYVSHPMMDEEGAEIVLMHYAKRNGKKNLETEEHSDFPKKGFCLAIGALASRGYFAFSAETQYSDFYDFCDGQLSGQNLGSLFGIALRIPNPDYNGPSTRLKTAVYKGVPESLYSDVLPVRVSYDEENDYWGIGLA